MELEERLQQLLGVRVRAMREGAGWSQEDFARHANLSRGYYARLERGVENPTWVVLARIAGALGLQPDALLATIVLDLDAVRRMPARRRMTAERTQQALIRAQITPGRPWHQTGLQAFNGNESRKYGAFTLMTVSAWPRNSTLVMMCA